VELNLAEIHEAIAEAVPDRPCLIWRDRTWTWAEVTERTRRFANLLAGHGIGRRGDLATCAGWESPHDHVALYATNGNAYLEAMLGASKAGAVAVNVNYRYVSDELAYLLDDSRAAAVVYQGMFAPTLAEALARTTRAPLLLRVDDGTPDSLLPGALDYEEALAGASPARPAVTWSPDDLYVLYTGGTTGAPKGVLWRQADFLVAALGVRAPDGGEVTSLDQLVSAARERSLRALPAPPFMHGAAHWNALSCWIGGGTVVVQDHTDRLDPADVLDTCARHQVTSLLIVGDAFARPLVDEQRRAPRDLRHLRHLLTGGAILSPAVQAELLELLPDLHIVDVLGSSETGRQAVATTSAAAPGDAGRFRPAATATVLRDDRTGIVDPADPSVGWLAQGGRVPRGYLGDPDKTAATFPVVEGRRWAVAGDRARWRADGTIELLGREAVTINTGGEKVFAEEVERALKAHPGVFDVLVVGRPDERWGQEVVAVVAPRGGEQVDLAGLRSVAGDSLARYKLPRALAVVDRIERSPSGKPDYAWARTVAEGAT
jgi:acyl-CoA synthetase (AMP-forming)/AMP-acid ligase II